MPDHDHDHDHSHGAGGAARASTNTTTQQLVDAASQITTLSQVMDRILATYVEPPQPDKPTAISATSTIQLQATHITDVANRIMTLLRSTV